MEIKFLSSVVSAHDYLRESIFSTKKAAYSIGLE